MSVTYQAMVRKREQEEEERHRQLHALLARARASTHDNDGGSDAEGQGGWERALNPPCSSSLPPLPSSSSLYGGGSEAVTMGAILEELRLLTVENLELHATCKQLQGQLAGAVDRMVRDPGGASMPEEEEEEEGEEVHPKPTQ